jgi:hypothetical protein
MLHMMGQQAAAMMASTVLMFGCTRSLAILHHCSRWQ